jgi:hypothetical protein
MFRGRERTGRLGGVVGVLLVVLLALAPPAALAKLPAYRSPGYRGTTKVPRLRAQTTPAAKPVELSGAGRFPDVYVDAAGTSHIVWTEDDGDNADVVRYCRLKRGASSCDNPPESQRLVWTKDYGDGDGPQFNIDQSGPRVVVIGDQLVVLSYRFPTIAAKPDGSDPDKTLLAWVSDNGGTSFSGPAIVGNGEIEGGAIAFGPEDDPTILTMNQTVTLCHSCVQAIRPGQFTSAAGSLGADGTDQAYSGTLALDGSTPVAAFSDLGRTTFVRRWSGAGSSGDPATWSAPFSVPGDEPQLAGGLAGAFLMNQPDFHGPFVVRKLASGSAGRATTVSDDDDPVLRDLFEDPSGRLLAGWVSRDGRRPGVRLRTSTDGRAWATPQQLLDGASAGQLAIGAADDGGGVVTLNRTGGVNSVGPIAAVAVGPRTPTGRVGLGSLAGGGDANATSGCEQITFGVVKIQSPSGCFFKGTGRNAGVNVTNGEIDFNGMKIVPDAGARIMIDARNHTLDTTGPVRALLRGGGVGEIVLWHGPLHVALPDAVEGIPFSFPTDGFHADLKGFGIVGRIDVYLTRGGVRIPVSLKLPPYLGGVTGEAVLLADSRTGLHLDSLVIDVEEALVGPLVIRDLHIGYAGTEERWDGSATLDLPPQPGGASVAARVVFIGGDFDSGELVVTPPFPPGIPIGPGVWLSKVGGGVRLSPLALTLIGQFGALPLSPKGPFSVTVDGRATVDFGSPLTFTFDGTGNVVDIALANAHLLANVDGYATLRAGMQFDLDVVSGSGSMEATFDGPRKQFLADLHGNVGIAGQDFADAEALASNIGFAGCYKLLIASLGFGYTWSTRTPEIMFPSCDLSAYKPTAGGGGGGQGGPVAVGSSFTVRAGTPSVSVQVDGDGGLPQVVLVAPDGQRIEPPIVTPLPTDPTILSLLRQIGVMALPVSPTRLTIGIVSPKAGTWRIEPAAGAARSRGGGAHAHAAAIAGVQVATGLEPPTVSARVGGRGRTRTLAYRATRRDGLKVTFLERFRGGTRTIGSARPAGDGTLSFSTGSLPGGRRTVIALLAQDGVPRLQRTVASYTAPPPPRPARVRGVRIGRAGGGIVVRWARASGAEAYLVRVTIGDGRRVARLVGQRTRSLRVARVAKRYAASATVAGRTRAGRVGPAGRAASAGRAPRVRSPPRR